MVEGLKKLCDNVKELNTSLEKFFPIVGSTGLDLSIPALRGLKRAIAEGKDPEPIHPEGCGLSVVQEILGTDQEMTREIWETLGWSYNPERLQGYPTYDR